MKETEVLSFLQQATVDKLTSPDHAPIDLGREPLTQAQSAYQSRVFKTTTNHSLVSIAAPLLTLATQLREQPTKPNLPELHHFLCHEIKVFESQSHALDYRSPIILAARYFLCSFLDETILSTTWGKQGDWKTHNLLNTFQRESWGGERFFVIVERSLEDPKLHVDLLELAYLCLSLGYEGKYQRKPEGHHELAQWRDRLYHLIYNERGEFSRRLSMTPTAKPKPKKLFSLLPPLWATIAATAFVLIGIYTTYHVRLTKMTSPFNQLLQQVTRPQS